MIVNKTDKDSKNPLISVIIPVYNVIEYLTQCVESVTTQTYTNIEILLIDDGSTDGSGELCEQIAKCDHRIRVYHKSNGGLSSARNYGLSKALGEWIGFVDSDDYIESVMYEYLLDLCKKYSVKLSAARFDEVGDNINDSTPLANGKERLFSSDEFLEKVLGYDKKYFCTMSVWDRLYHKSIICNLQFPDGKCYEDIVYSTNAILNAEQCAYSNRILYHYRIRADSISHQEDNYGVEKKIFTDRLPLQCEQLKLLSGLGKDKLVKTARCAYFQEYVYLRYFNENKNYDKIINRSLEYFKPTVLEILQSKIVTTGKIKLIIKMKFSFITKIIYFCKSRYKNRNTIFKVKNDLKMH